MTECAAQLDAALNALDASLAAQDAGVQGAFNWLITPAGVMDQQRGALELWKQQVGELESIGFANVQAGTRSLQSWFNTAHAIHDAIASTTSDIGTWNWDGIVSGTASQTASDVKTGALAAGQLAAVGFGAAVPLVAGAFVLYWLFMLGGRRG